MRYFFFVRAFGLVVMLAGCGGSNTADGVVGDANLRSFQDALIADDAQRLAIMGDADANIRGIPGTVWTSVPTTGQAIFRGVGLGQIGENLDNPDLILRGDVFITMNFGADDINGGMVRLSGSDGVNAYDITGEVDFFNGNIGAVRPSGFTLDYTAELGVGGQTYALDGNMDGLLRGTRFSVVRRSPVKAMSAIDDDGVAVVGGRAVPLELTIVGETN